MKKTSILVIVFVAIAGVALFVIHRPQPQTLVEEVRAVRTITAKDSVSSGGVALTGEIRAENEAGLAFRIDGKITERLVSMGDTIKPDQVIARLDEEDMRNNLMVAKADLQSAQATLSQAINDELRQRTLRKDGYTTQTKLDQAQKALGVARANIESTTARVKLAEDQLHYATLKSDVAGVVTETLAEAGEVVHTGQVVVRIAQDGGRDAVFDVSETIMPTEESQKKNLRISISLSNNPAVQTEGRVREISPEADPVTRTFRVKVGLINPPSAMRLGAVVTGKASFPGGLPVISIPAMALNRQNKAPAVWIVDPASAMVSLHPVDIDRYDSDTVTVRNGVKEGDVVVISGVHALRPGQKVRLMTDQTAKDAP